MAPMEVDGDTVSVAQAAEFAVTHQEVSLDVDFANRALKGETALIIQPLVKNLKYIPLNCRQVKVESVSVDGRPAQMAYDDPYDRLTARPEYGVHQHHLIQDSLESTFRYSPEGELLITLPKEIRIKELSVLELQSGHGQHGDSTGPLDSQIPKAIEDGAPVYRSITVTVRYTVSEYRDPLHWVGLEEADQRYPHMYTRHQVLPNETACFIFPCVDSLTSRPTWTFTIRCPRTLGDLIDDVENTDQSLANGYMDIMHTDVERNDGNSSGHRANRLTDEEKELEIAVICSGYMEDSDASGETDPSKRRWVFSCSTPTAPQHVGFAIGPFEQVDLSDYRESDQDEKLGDQAVRLHAFCLPGRAEEVQNSCGPLAMALDYFTVNYGSYPFEAEATSHKMVFVDDLARNVVDTATMSICSSRLLLPPEILDGMVESLRELVHAIASQWLGVNVVPRNPSDYWIIVGGSYFMTDSYLQTLYGRNEHRFRQKMAADKVFELDVRRPSIRSLGDHVALDPSNLEFLVLKAPLVLFILDQRIVKGSGRNGVTRILWRLLLDIKVGKIPTNDISTMQFMRTCERVGHIRLDAFFQQWIYGAGCPTFHVSQRFNKKKLVVEMIITQQQADANARTRLNPEVFMRDLKEDENNVWAGELQPVFTGPMTIRIHEADGTPYEHIVDIRDKTTKVEIPYNTKYKRLKRSKRQKERQANAVGIDVTGDPTDDVLFYCLGDVLQTAEEMAAWRLVEWSKDEEERMEQEFFEWIRMDKDFEWICKIQFGQPHYMYVSQLQQDNDVVAQVESIRYLQAQKPHKMISTILIRTLMDSRYFHGIRTMAADALVNCATDESECDWAGLFHLRKAFEEMFCLSNSPMTRSNDFSNRASYILQCAIPRAMARIRDSKGRVPDQVKSFFIDKLKFNDNTNNDYSDSFYIATLMSCLARSLVVERKTGDFVFEMGDEDQEDVDAHFKRVAIGEIHRHRRIDEWIPSFQNIFTVTGLECLSLLVRERIEPRRWSDLLQYTKPGNADQVRLKAFSCLVELDAMRDPVLMRYIFQSYFTEPSPYIRTNLWQIIGRGLGMIAIGAPETEKTPEVNGLMIESEGVELRQQAILRTQTVDGAQSSLKSQLKDLPVLKEVIMDGLRSPIIGHADFLEILTLCRMLYEPINSLVFSRRLPAYWNMQNLGNGQLRFYKTDHYRTTPLPKLDLKELKRPREASEDIEPESPEAKRRRVSESPDAKRLKELKRPRVDKEDGNPQQPDAKRRRMPDSPGTKNRRSSVASTPESHDLPRPSQTSIHSSLEQVPALPQAPVVASPVLKVPKKKSEAKSKTKGQSRLMILKFQNKDLLRRFPHEPVQKPAAKPQAPPAVAKPLARPATLSRTSSAAQVHPISPVPSPGASSPPAEKKIKLKLTFKK